MLLLISNDTDGDFPPTFDLHLEQLLNPPLLDPLDTLIPQTSLNAMVNVLAPRTFRA